MAAYKTFGCIGEIANPIFPILDPGRPLFILFQFSPPSTLLYSAVPGPPSINAATFLCLCQLAKYKMFGFSGLITRSVTPVHSFISSLFSHDFPPSTDLNKPRSPPELHKGPWAATQITLGLFG